MQYNNVILQFGTTLKKMNTAIILETYHFYQGNKSQAARVLDISVRTLDKYLEAHELALKEETERLREAQEITENFRLRQRGKIPPGSQVA